MRILLNIPRTLLGSIPALELVPPIRSLVVLPVNHVRQHASPATGEGAADGGSGR